MRPSLYPWVCEFELCLSNYNFLNLNLSLIFDKFMLTNAALCECLSPIDVFNKLDLDPLIHSSFSNTGFTGQHKPFLCLPIKTY